MAEIKVTSTIVNDSEISSVIDIVSGIDASDETKSVVHAAIRKKFRKILSRKDVVSRLQPDINVENEVDF